METIQVVLDTKLRQEADRAAKRGKMNRSALIREALRKHLKELRIKEMEEREIRAYQLCPETEEEKNMWAGETVWLDD